MTSSTTRQRRVAAVAVALLAVLCGVLLAEPATAGTPGASAGVTAGAEPKAAAAAPGAAVADPLDAGTATGRASHHPDTRNSPGTGSPTGAGISPGAADSSGPDDDPDAVSNQHLGQGGDIPGCQEAPDDAGSLPVMRSGPQQNEPMLPAERPAPESFGLLNDSCAASPAPGPSPIRAPSPVTLSVLRV